MKVLTLWQPWASLVVLGVKTIETRSYPVNRLGGHPELGETIAIHAAARRPTVADMAAVFNSPKALGAWIDAGYRYPVVSALPAGEQLVRYGRGCSSGPLGALIGTCRITAHAPMTGPRPDLEGTDHVDFTRSPMIWHHPTGWVNIEHQRHLGWWEPGRWAWLLDDIHRFDTPVVARGRQGWWTTAALDGHQG